MTLDKIWEKNNCAQLVLRQTGTTIFWQKGEDVPVLADTSEPFLTPDHSSWSWFRYHNEWFESN